MKRCVRCHKLLPESEFYKDKRKKAGLWWCCRKCENQYHKEYNYRKAEEQDVFDKSNEIIGGYKVSILNHASRTENKYTIVGTDGNYYATNDKGAFLDYLRSLL